MFKAVDKKSKSLQFCYPSEMQIASDLSLVKSGMIFFKFGTHGSLSNMAFETYVQLSDGWRSNDSLITLIVFERLKKIINFELS